MTVTYWEAWQRWGAGDAALRDAYLWGLQVFWWARIGKVLAFLAGFIIVMDILGPERIIKWFKLRTSDLVSVGDVYKETRIPFSLRTSLKRLVYSFAVTKLALSILMLILIFYVPNQQYWWLKIFPVLTLIILVFPQRKAINVGIGKVLTAWLTANARIIKGVQIASLFLFIVGFHFDMLGS